MGTSADGFLDILYSYIASVALQAGLMLLTGSLAKSGMRVCCPLPNRGHSYGGVRHADILRFFFVFVDIESHAALQAGLVHFTRSISGKLAKSGVRICCLCPQPVDTPMVSNMQSLGLPMPETGASLLTPQRVSRSAAGTVVIHDFGQTPQHS